jgi:aryl-alcohol dehydrogenase-like predicted oxidoreductase
MEKRRFGRTDHTSTVAILGGAAFYEVEQKQADEAMARACEMGINHIDVAPSYGLAEERLAPWLAHSREDFFLGCKTLERTREGAAADLRSSLDALDVEAFDLYQLHAITTMERLDAVTEPGGALEALIDGREAGLTRFIGITAHGFYAPEVILEALARFDFDTVLFPLNFVLFANPTYRHNAEALLQECRTRDVGVMAIKAITRGPWGEKPATYDTWYEPFDDPAHIQQCINFALSQAVTGLCTVGDVTLLPLFLEACEGFAPMHAAEQNALMGTASRYESLFVEESD